MRPGGRRSRAIALAVGVMAAAASAIAGVSVARGASSSATDEYRLVQYPGAGFGGFYRQIAQARTTIDMEMYELQDTTAERDLAAAAARGVTVRVLLDRDFSGARANAAAVAYLRGHGVQVRWAPAGYIFHIKATTFDGRTSDISTANLTARYYASTRDAEIVDDNPVQVRAIEQTFANDWTAGAAGTPRTQTVQAPGLVWSPDTGSGTAQTALVGQIAAARTSVDFTSEELSDPAIYHALSAAAARGVACRIVMTDSSDWDTAFAAVTRAGCRVRVFPDSDSALYIHEKLILDDAGTATQSMLIGSQNASVTSLTRNRELGVRLTGAHGGAAVIRSAARTFETDFANASAWSAPGSAGGTGAGTGSSAGSGVGAGCHPRSAAGHCYEPGELCAAADHGLTGVAGDGEPIVCTKDDGWRWESAG
jgi:cardiolipin synthase A/B